MLKSGERMALQVCSFSPTTAHPEVLIGLLDTRAAVNAHFARTDKDIRIWLEFSQGPLDITTEDI